MTADNVTVKNAAISSKYSYEDIGEPNYEDVRTSELYGGVAGLISTNLSIANIKNCNVEDCEISAKQAYCCRWNWIYR